MEIAARELVPALARAAPGVRFTAFVGRDARGVDLGIDRVVLPVRAANRADWVRGEQLVLPRAAERAGCDLVHSLASTAPATGRFRRVTTCTTSTTGSCRTPTSACAASACARSSRSPRAARTA